MAFSELYTRAQSLVNTLTECDVRGRILTSQELVELLFISYNREQRDTYDFEEYMSQSGFDSFYSVTEDVLQKRMAAINEEIERKGNERAIEAYKRTNKRIEAIRKAAEDREKRMQEYIDNLANEIVDNEKEVIGEEMAKKTKENIKKLTQKEQKEQNEINKEKKKVHKLTEEERKRRLAIRRRRLMKEREKNGIIQKESSSKQSDE